MLSQYLENLEKRYKKPQESNLGIALRSELANQIVRSEMGGNAYSRLTFINDNRDLTTVELQFDCTGGEGGEGDEIDWDAGEISNVEQIYQVNEIYGKKNSLRLDEPEYPDYERIDLEAEDWETGEGDYVDNNYIELRNISYPVGFAVHVEEPLSLVSGVSKKLFLIVDQDQDYDELEDWADDYNYYFEEENEGQELEIKIIPVDPFIEGFLKDEIGERSFRWNTNIRGIANFLDKNDYIDLDKMYRTLIGQGKVDLVAILNVDRREYWSWPLYTEDSDQCDITFTVNGSMALGGGRKQAQTVFAFVTREVKHWVETLEPDEIKFSGTSERVRLYERLARMIEESGYDNLTYSSGSGIQARLVRQ